MHEENNETNRTYRKEKPNKVLKENDYLERAIERIYKQKPDTPENLVQDLFRIRKMVTDVETLATNRINDLAGKYTEDLQSQLEQAHYVEDIRDVVKQISRRYREVVYALAEQLGLCKEKISK